MDLSLFDIENLFAWCVASHDPPERKAAERVGELHELGFRQYAWGNRMTTIKYLPQFDSELAAMRENDIRLLARWIPSEYQEAEFEPLLDHLAENGLAPLLWVTGGGDAAPGEAGHREMLESEMRRLRPIAAAAARRGLGVSLYNHAGWFGDPRNRVVLAGRLADEGFENIGLVQSMHWAHDFLDDFEELLELMRPRLHAVVLNGTFRGGRDAGRHLVPIGAGPEDERILRALLAAGWKGPLGILNHTTHPASLRLRDNLDGLRWLAACIGGTELPPPQFRTWPEA